MIRVPLEKGSAEIVDRIDRPRRSGGVNWGSRKIFVLARRGEKELWRTSGCSTSARMLAPSQYDPGELLLVPRGEHHWRSYGCQTETVQLQEGGRISGKTFRKHAAKIDAFFGVKIAHLLNVKSTVLITDKEM